MPWAIFHRLGKHAGLIERLQMDAVELAMWLADAFKVFCDSLSFVLVAEFQRKSNSKLVTSCGGRL